MKVLGLIPARGGSKGVPRKNIKPLCGKPLIAYTIESATTARRLSRLIVSTEDAEIAEISRKFGADVPFLRPRELAEDSSPTLPSVVHAIRELESHGEHFDAVCLLQPTNPLRRPHDIDGCIELLEATGADSVVSILRVPDHYNPKWVYWQKPDGGLVLSTGDDEPVARRQDLPEAFHREGSVYVTRRDVVVDDGTLYGRDVRGYELDPMNAVNIDTPADWAAAERAVAGLANDYDREGVSSK